MNIFEPFLSWIGGFFDGDGSIGLSKRIRRREGHEERFEFVPFLTISQSDRGILESIQRVLGDGKIFLNKKRGQANNWGIEATRDGFSLRCDNAAGIRVTKKLLPYTIIKAPELIEVISYYEAYNNYTKGWARWRHQSNEYYRRYEKMIQEGDSCRARLNLLRSNKDTIDVSVST